jgi:hypothetical protein
LEDFRCMQCYCIPSFFILLKVHCHQLYSAVF